MCRLLITIIVGLSPVSSQRRASILTLPINYLCGQNTPGPFFRTHFSNAFDKVCDILGFSVKASVLLRSFVPVRHCYIVQAEFQTFKRIVKKEGTDNALTKKLLMVVMFK